MLLLAKKLRLSALPTAAIAMFASSLALSSALAQSPAPPPPANSASPAAPATDISDQKLKAAATAIPQVEGIRQNYQTQIAQAPDADKARLESQAGDRMTKAIADQGLSIPEYNSILETAEHDPAIRARLIKELPQQGQDQEQEPDHPPGP